MITFDDISGRSNTSGVIPNGYKNLNWNNAEYVSVSSMPENSGYQAVTRNSSFVMDNPSDGNITITTENGTLFWFDSFGVNSAWRDSLNFTIKLSKNGQLTGGNSFVIFTNLKTDIPCDGCEAIDTIFIEGQGGIINASRAQNGTQFIIENLCISFEP